MEASATSNALVGDLEYPMFIVTARAGGEPLGCLVAFATQISIDPPRFAVCLSHNNRTYRCGHDAELLGVHCVPEHATALAELFGGETGDEVDKFARCAWHEGPAGVPILDECPNWFVGRVLWRSDAETTTRSCSSRSPPRTAPPRTSSRSTARSRSSPGTRPDGALGAAAARRGGRAHRERGRRRGARPGARGPAVPAREHDRHRGRPRNDRRSHRPDREPCRLRALPRAADARRRGDGRRRDRAGRGLRR